MLPTRTVASASSTTSAVATGSAASDSAPGTVGASRRIERSRRLSNPAINGLMSLIAMEELGCLELRRRRLEVRE